jgi:hypothetical protein
MPFRAASAPLITLAGEVTDLFGHRFVLVTANGKILADLGPKGLEEISLSIGDKVTLTGEQKPSEVKVHGITHGGRTVTLPHGKDKHGPHGEPDHEAALAAVKAAGFEPVGSPRRKPKHFEIDGRRGNEFVELHVELDGHIRKTKPAERRP